MNRLSKENKDIETLVGEAERRMIIQVVFWMRFVYFEIGYLGKVQKHINSVLEAAAGVLISLSKTR